MNNPKPFIASFLALAAFLVSPSWARAQVPTTVDPQYLFPIVFGSKTVFSRTLKDVHKSAYEGVSSIEKKLSEMEALIAAGKLKQVADTKIEALYMDIVYLERAADQLKAWGELAGVDVSRRAANYRQRVVKLAQQRSVDPELQKQLKNRLKWPDKEIQAAQQGVNEASRLLGRKEPERAQLQYWRSTDKIEPKTLWYGLNGLPDKPVTFKNYETTRNGCTSALEVLWRAEAAKACAEALNKIKADYARLIQDADKAAATLKQGGSAAARGGPAEVAALGARWRQLEQATLHARGWAWYHHRLGGPDQKSVLASAQQGQSAKVAAALGKIIEASAAGATEEQVPELYRQYVNTLAPLLTLASVRSIQDAFRQPLDALAARSPALLAEVQAYQNATEELLRWRERIAGAMAAARMAKSPPLDQVIRDAATPLRTGQGPLLTTDQARVIARFLGVVPDSIGRIKPLVGKQATASELLGMALPNGTRAPRGVGAYGQPVRCYVKVSPDSAKEAIAVLERDLMATPSQLPLTLEGRVALLAAREGDLAFAGGRITRLGLVPWGEHFVTLPDEMRGPMRLGPMLPDDADGNELVMLLEIDAQWMAGRHYCVDVPQEEPKAAAK